MQGKVPAIIDNDGRIASRWGPVHSSQFWSASAQFDRGAVTSSSVDSLVHKTTTRVGTRIAHVAVHGEEGARPKLLACAPLGLSPVAAPTACPCAGAQRGRQDRADEAARRAPPPPRPLAYPPLATRQACGAAAGARPTLRRLPDRGSVLPDLRPVSRSQAEPPPPPPQATATSTRCCTCPAPPPAGSRPVPPPKAQTAREPHVDPPLRARRLPPSHTAL